MLSNKLRRGSAIISTAAIVLTSAAVPVSAKKAVTKTEPVITTVINENFDSYEVKDYADLTNQLKDFEANSDISYKHYVDWDSKARKMAIEADDTEGKNGNILAFDNNCGIKLNFDNPNGSTPVNEGDVVTISFRYKFATNNQKIKINLNNNTSGRYMKKSGKSNVNGNAQWGSQSWSDTQKSRLAVLDLDAGDDKGGNHEYPNMATYHVAEYDRWKEETITKDEWHTMTITINTKDSSKEDTQTIKVASDDGSYFYGLYDANYTGADDSTYDRFTEISSFQLDTYGCSNRTEGGTDYISIDDVSVTVEGKREVTEYLSELDTTLINEDFSDLTASETVKDNWSKDVRADLAGTGFKYGLYGGGVSVGNVYNDTEKALSITSNKDAWNCFALYADCAEQQIAPGGILNISFDYYQTSSNKMCVMLQGIGENGVAYKSIKSTNRYDTNYNATDGWQTNDTNIQTASKKDNKAKIAVTGHHALANEWHPAEMLSPVAANTGGNTAQRTFNAGKWYTVEISIDTKNEKFDGKQTMSLKYKERGTDTYSQEYFGYLDADASTLGTVDALTSFKGFDIGIETFKEDTSIYVDNVKTNIQKPGYELWGAASNGHEADGKFIQGQDMYIKAAADPSSFKEITMNEDGTEISKIEDKNTDMMLIAALYDTDGKLIGTELANKTLSSADPYIETGEFNTKNAKTIKTFLWELQSIKPYLQSETFEAAND